MFGIQNIICKRAGTKTYNYALHSPTGREGRVDSLQQGALHPEHFVDPLDLPSDLPREGV